MSPSPRLPAALRRLIVAGAALALGACSPSKEAVVAKHRDAVQALFGRIAALQATATRAAAIGADRVDAGGARIVLDGAASNAVMIRASDLATPDHASSDGNGAVRAGTLASCGRILRGEFLGEAEGAELLLSECERAEYLFVLRTVGERAAAITGVSTFQPGAFEGEVLLFRIRDGAALGGFRATATNSKEVMAHTDKSGAAKDVADRLASDLSANAFAAIDAKLRALLPGSLP